MKDRDKQTKEMDEFNRKLYELIDKEMPGISEPHVIGGVLAACLQSFWLHLMGPESTAAAFRHVADHVEEMDWPPQAPVLH